MSITGEEKDFTENVIINYKRVNFLQAIIHSYRLFNVTPIEVLLGRSCPNTRSP